MKKLLFVGNGFNYRHINYGGVNKMFLWLGNTFAESGYDVTFCCIHDKKRAEKISSKAKSIELGIPAHNNYLRKHTSYLFHSTVQLRKVLKDGNYDYVFNFDGLAFYVLLFLRRFHSFQFVVSERADPNYNQSKLASLKRRLYQFADILVCQTEGAKSFFSLKTQKKSVVIPNPIEIPMEQWDIKSTSKQVAQAARLHIWQKRQDVLLKAFSIFSKTHTDYILNIYGDGPDDKQLKEMAMELGLGNSVIFHGNTTNVREKLLKNEIFVLTSDFEGMPNALMEAMALGMPVISTKCSPGGAEALIHDEEDGILTDCGDEKGIADALCKYADNQQIEERYGKQARQTMKRYNPKEIIKLWEQLL